jgi:hypothetical protein
MNNYAEGKGVPRCGTDVLGAEQVYALRRS